MLLHNFPLKLKIKTYYPTSEKITNIGKYPTLDKNNIL